MSDDVLTLGGITFDNFSTPEKMGAGGKQAMVIHKLPGGSRVIDTLGPDEDDITWSHFFFSDDAESKVLALDAMRASGQVVSLTFGGQSRQVIINHFSYHYRRRPVYIEYEITCTVFINPSLGDIGATTSSITNLVIGDLAFAVSLL